MKSVDLNANWKVVTNEEYTCDLPHDAMNDAPRDYTCAFGERNGYHPAMTAEFTKRIPAVKGENAQLVISGTCGYGDVYLCGEKLGALKGYAPTVFDLTDKLGGLHNELKLSLTAAPEMSDKYTGLGVAGGVSLILTDTLDFKPRSFYVTSSVSGDKTYADATVTIVNNGDAVKFVLDTAVYNSRGKRAGRKQRKIFMRANTEKTFTVRVRIPRAYEWSPDDPYMYTATARIVNGEYESTVDAPFGIVTRSLNPIRGLYLNNRNTLLMGAYVSHADGVLGGVSNYSNEFRRFSALKELGYNAVHFVECPAEATLDALDDVGMYAFVDILPCMSEGKSPLDSHIFFDGDPSCVDASVYALRAHPCVTVYGVADDVSECYGRNGGHEIIQKFAARIKQLDGSRPTTVSSRELVPTVRELENAGIHRRFDSDSAMINAGREKDLFDSLTAGAFEAVDVCGFNYLYPLYGTETNKRGRLVLGSRTSSDRAFDSLDETEKNTRVIGDFCDCGIDYPGCGKLNENYCTQGDLDILLDKKPQAEYKKILLGERNVAYITVLDPDTQEPVAMWNWPRYLGQPITVRVYTTGDVVALYLDGKLIGRKLAGKVNKHIATFTTEYYPGTLEAVCYFKGVECARASIRSAGSPKMIKLSADEKSLYLSRGDLGFLHIDVCDKEGNPVPYAMRELTATVTGGKLVAMTNADPMLRKSAFDTCPAFGGKALCVIAPDKSEDRAVVKITGEGLLSAKLTFKIKD